MLCIILPAPPEFGPKLSGASYPQSLGTGAAKSFVVNKIKRTAKMPLKIIDFSVIMVVI